MSPQEFIEYFGKIKASAILRTSIADAAKPAMDAAIRGGFRVVEFTLTTPGALDLIREFSQRTELVVGAGTVLTVDDAQAAVDAGASFLVSPVFDPQVIETACSMNVAVMPGTHTPTEMLEAHRAGAKLLKLFPAPGVAPGAGPEYVRSILGPMPFLKIVPTNGVNMENAQAYLDAGAFAVGFTNALFDAEEISNRRFNAIETRAEQLIAAVRQKDD